MPKLFVYPAAFLCLLTCSLATASVPPSFDFRIHPASADTGGGREWVIEISSVPNIRYMDGLLTPSTGSFSHEGYFFLWDMSTGEAAVIPFELDIPLVSDLDHDGRPDFFELGATFNLQSSRGTYLHPISGEPVSLTAFWSRSENGAAGKVCLLFEELSLVVFHEFELLSFGGMEEPWNDEHNPFPAEYLLPGQAPPPSGTLPTNPLDSDAAGSETTIIPGYPADQVISKPTKEISLAWDPNQEPDLAGYHVYVVKPGSIPRRLRTSATQVTIRGLEAGITYAFYVTAFNRSGTESAPSESVSYTVPWITHLDRTRIGFEPATLQ